MVMVFLINLNMKLLSLPEELSDYVILHVGYALTRLDEDEAQKTLALFAEMLQGESI